MRSATRNKTGKDPAYLEWIRTLPCAVCYAQKSPTQAHHAGVRGFGQRADDRTAVPLCGQHHDRGRPNSVHTLGKKFWDFWAIDKDRIIEDLNRRYEQDINRVD